MTNYEEVKAKELTKIRMNLEQLNRTLSRFLEAYSYVMIGEESVTEEEIKED